MTRTQADGVPLSSQAGTEFADRQIEMENERLRKIAEGSTYFQHAQASANDEAGGRFAKPTAVVGANPISYPQLPESSPWAQPWPEGPDVYGVPIDEMPVIGEPFEQEAAQRILDDRLAAPPASGASDDVPAVSLATAELSEAPTSSQSPDVAFSVSAKRGTAAMQVTVPRNSFRRL
jgi:hypothetical protein